jgi:hypothetical protein
MASTTCVNPNNQFIYQALLEKAASYPADKTYQIKAYQKVAEFIATLCESIYDEVISGEWELYGSCIPGAGPNIEKFIDNFILTNPQPPKYYAEARKIAAQNAPVSVPELPKINPDASWPVEAQNALEDFKKNVMELPEPTDATAATTRRSARLKYKPTKSYKYEDPYDSEDIPDDAEVDDERDEDYVPQQDEDDEDEETELMMLFRKGTKKYNLTDDELKEVVKVFETFYEANKDNKGEYIIWDATYDCKTKTLTNHTMRSMKDIAYQYISDSNSYTWKSLDDPFVGRYENPILNRAHFNKTFRNIMIKELAKMGMEYDERLMDRFWSWFMDPTKKEQSHHKCPYTLKMVRPTKNEATRQFIKSTPKRFIF